MRAAVLFGKQDLRIENLPPAEPGASEVAVQIAYGGICGSDLSYFTKGRVGDFTVNEPMVLGHEVSGTVAAVGDGVTNVKPGMRVAVNPSRPCLQCDYCRSGRSNLCRNMRFLGSAAVTPHVQGGFAERLIVRSDQCVAVPSDLSMRAASCGEPLSVALHAMRQAGNLLGKRVLISGAGPIGLMCVLAAVKAGATEVHSTDIVDAPLSVAKTLGAVAHNVGGNPALLEPFAAGKGYFDVGFEASGAPSALATHIRIVRPGGRIIQLGMLPPGDIPVPMNVLQAQELELIGSFRFHEEFYAAVQGLATRQYDVSPILSAEFTLDKARDAFELAGDRNRALKVHIAFN
jgi:L-idonate 5-dehydrogenase